MIEFYTKNIIEWQSLMFEKHNLKFNITQWKGDFFSHIKTTPVLNDLVFSEVKTTPYKADYISNKNNNPKDTFLLTYSRNHFIGEQYGRVFDIKRQTFLLNMNDDFNGRYVNDGNTKSCLIPFELIESNSLDSLINKSLFHHPLYSSIDLILKSMSVTDSNHVLDLRLKSIIYNLSLSDLLEKHDFIDDVRIFIKREIAFGKKINLDALCSQFNMSRRKMQYIFTENKTTYLGIIKEIKAEL
ncbi:hypothetical protein ERW51_02415 [Aliivibrio finisterrensis]|uniref:hypothetical protein n=1 Tax=Aliivibrio finisterrensis TaxID=511998 RepID=UPI00101FC833|nr:hypothetical protein [Aliivibrio finisterrensis]RYU70386.1 hypothetical protein ERW54_02420 [Aliivibrio finisterrensis]RYU74248.1 hypothetical protein ERW51_02415 [Aliivibrio finisterrensis]RYU76853.1 hypothetical protein ERW48_02430 [Aliivibrio finisterrensis]